MPLACDEHNTTSVITNMDNTNPAEILPTITEEPTTPKPVSNRRQFLKRLLLSGLASSLPASAYASLFEPNYIRLATLDVPIRGLPSEADGLRIGHLSDVHCDDPRAIERARHAAELLREQKPDIVFFTGDYVTHDPHHNMTAAAEALAILSDAPHGAFAILGNHDWWSGDPDHVASELTRVGFHVLRNQSAFIQSKGIWVIGLDQRCDSKQDVSQALKDVPKDTIKLLLVHEPDYADEAPAGFALQFSGHSHGGQVRIPGFPPIIVPTYSRRYPEGLQQGQNHLVYTTRGVGMISPKVRFCCPPEVAVLRLTKASI